MYKKRKERCQRNVTITNEQLEFVKANHGKIDIGTIGKMLGISYQKLHNNLRLVGLVKSTPRSAPVIKMEGYFDIDEFGKYYDY